MAPFPFRRKKQSAQNRSDARLTSVSQVSFSPSDFGIEDDGDSLSPEETSALDSDAFLTAYSEPLHSYPDSHKLAHLSARSVLDSYSQRDPEPRNISRQNHSRLSQLKRLSTSFSIVNQAPASSPFGSISTRRSNLTRDHERHLNSAPLAKTSTMRIRPGSKSSTPWASTSSLNLYMLGENSPSSSISNSLPLRPGIVTKKSFPSTIGPSDNHHSGQSAHRHQGRHQIYQQKSPLSPSSPLRIEATAALRSDQHSLKNSRDFNGDGSRMSSGPPDKSSRSHLLQQQQQQQNPRLKQKQVLDSINRPRAPMSSSSSSASSTADDSVQATDSASSSSLIFERQVQPPPSVGVPAITAHHNAENHIAPVLDASCEALVDTSLDPELIEVVTANRLSRPSMSSLQKSISSTSLSSRFPSSPGAVKAKIGIPNEGFPSKPVLNIYSDSGDSAISSNSTYNGKDDGNLLAQDSHRRLSFYTYADLVSNPPSVADRRSSMSSTRSVSDMSAALSIKSSAGSCSPAMSYCSASGDFSAEPPVVITTLGEALRHNADEITSTKFSITSSSFVDMIATRPDPNN
ncbi:hypothetical protein V1511DRAFT_511945 [Dipodascopsis uninucleata]